MPYPYITELTKFQQKELLRFKDLNFVITDNWKEFIEKAKSNDWKNGALVVMPYKASNGMWGLVFNQWQVHYWYFTASTDPTAERNEVNEKLKAYQVSLTAKETENSQSPKINTDNSVEFSQVYTNLMIGKIIEIQYYWNLANPPSDKIGWDKVNFSKSTIENYQKGELQNLKDVENGELAKWKSIFWTKDPNAVKTWYDNLTGYWGGESNFIKDYGNGYGIGADGLKNIKAKIDTLFANQEKHNSDDKIISKSDWDNDWSQRVKKSDYDSKVNELTTANNALKTTATDKDKKLTDQEQIISQRDSYIIEQEAIISDKNKTIAQLMQLVKEMEGGNDKLQAWQVVTGGN